MTGVNRLGGVVLGIILLAIGLLTVVETVALTAWNRAWPLPVREWHTTLLQTKWSDRSVLITAIIVGVVGLLLLAMQLRRGRPGKLDTAWRDRDDRWEIRRRSVERQVAGAAETIRGVEGVRVTTIGPATNWRIGVVTDAGGDVVDPAAVGQVVRAKLTQLGAPADTPVKVRVRHNGKVRDTSREAARENDVDPARDASRT